MDQEENGYFVSTQLDEEALTLAASLTAQKSQDSASSSGVSNTQQALLNNTWGILRQHTSEGIVEVMLHYRMHEGRKDTYILGRSRNSDIPIPDRRVSSTHCAVYCDYTEPRMRVFLEDCSANGTYVNDALTKLSRGHRMELRSGDEIYLVNPRTLDISDLHFHPSVFTFINMRDRILATREIAAAPAATATRSFVNATATDANNAASSEIISPGEPQIEDLYIIGDQIGSGMSGQVYLCVQRATGRRCAVKIIDTRKFSMTPGLAKEELLQEASLMQELKHPYIIEVIDTFHSPTAIYIVMELLEGGDLFDRIVERIRYTEDKARQVMFQILTALHYLHSHRVVHRDLKPENILLVSTKDDTQIKVTDFGLAKRVSAEGLRTFCGTPQYFAPEVLLRRNGSQQKGIGHYGMAADMWSMGVIMYIMLSGTFPFDDENLYDQIEQAKYSFAGNEWNHVSLEAKHMIRSLLTLRTDLRLTTQQALQHPWISGTKMSVAHASKLFATANTNSASSAPNDASRTVTTTAKRKSTLQRNQRKASAKNAVAIPQESASELVRQPSLLKRSSLSRLSFVVKSTTAGNANTTVAPSANSAVASTNSSLLATVLQMASTHPPPDALRADYNVMSDNIASYPSTAVTKVDVYDAGYTTPDDDDGRGAFPGKPIARALFFSPGPKSQPIPAATVARENSVCEKLRITAPVVTEIAAESKPDAVEVGLISPLVTSTASKQQKRTPRMTSISLIPNHTITSAQAPMTNKAENKIMEGDFQVLKSLTGGTASDILRDAHAHMDMAADDIAVFTSDEEEEGEEEEEHSGIRRKTATKEGTTRAKRLLSVSKTTSIHNNNSNSNNTTYKSPAPAPQKSILKQSAGHGSKNVSPANATSVSPGTDTPSLLAVPIGDEDGASQPLHPRKRKVNFLSNQDADAIPSSSEKEASAVELVHTEPMTTSSTTTQKRQRSLRDLWAVQPPASVVLQHQQQHLQQQQSLSMLEFGGSSLPPTHMQTPAPSTLDFSESIRSDGDLDMPRSKESPISTAVAVSHIKSAASNTASSVSSLPTAKASSVTSPSPRKQSALKVTVTNRSSPATNKLTGKRTYQEQKQQDHPISPPVHSTESSSTTTTSSAPRKKLRTPVHSLSALFANQQIMAQQSSSK